MKSKCLNPKCIRMANARGLCGSCFTVANRIVKERLITWAELESAGKAIPKVAQKKTGTVKEWLLGGGEQ